MTLSLAMILLSTLPGMATERCCATLPAGTTILVRYPFILCQEYGMDADLDLSDSLFNHLAIGVQFKVNRTEVDRDQAFFSTFNDTLIHWLRHENFQIVKLYIRGAASPEGSYANNRRLGQGRTDNLFHIIEAQLSQTGKHRRARVQATAVTEDYAYLADLMQEAGDADAEAVRQLLEQCQWDEPRCKRALQQMRGGQVWDRLVVEYFPRLRAARVVLLLRRMRPASPPVPDVTPLQPLDTIALHPVAVQTESLAVNAAAQPQVTWTRRHLIALRTNLLRDAFYMPQFGFAPGLDAQLEYYPLQGHYTYNAAFTWTQHRHWADHQFLQIRDLQLEARRYFRDGGTFLGPYVGAYAQAAMFGIGLSDTKGWEGEALGAGLDLGWVLPLNRKGNFRLEFNVSAGYLAAKHDPHVWGNPVTGKADGHYYYDYHGSAKNFIERNHLFQWFGPTNIGISFTYDIIYRKKTLKQ